MNLAHLGGQDTVTGSCHLLQHKGVNILVEGLMSEVRGQRSVAPGEAWSVGIDGDRAVLEIRYRSLMGSNPIR